MHWIIYIFSNPWNLLTAGLTETHLITIYLNFNFRVYWPTLDACTLHCASGHLERILNTLIGNQFPSFYN